MGKRMGSERLGSFYTGKRAKKRRNGAGSRTHSMIIHNGLEYGGVLLGFASKPNKCEGVFRYRWMLNFMVVPDFLTGIQKGCVILSFGLRIQL